MLSRAQRVARYGGRAPRYTSYPTANHFQPLDPGEVLAALPQRQEPLSVYVHVPYCTKLCWYCGCNTVIRRDRSIGSSWVDTLLAELDRVGEPLHKPRVAHLALGGGTPNFLLTDALERLVRGLREVLVFDGNTTLRTELDPRTVEPEQIHTLFELGFRGFSLGVQTLHPRVQEAINRPLSATRLWSIANGLRQLGATTLNLDLMVGLPSQTPQTLDYTLETVLTIRPDRFAVFQYAHMPSLRPAQRLLERAGLPGPEERDASFRHVTARLLEAGYERVGFDHFALPDDPLAIAWRRGTLARNFQGFTDDDARDLLALGPSAIGRIGRLYYQNHRDVGPWSNAVQNGELPVARGLRITDQDVLLGARIQELMCRSSTSLAALGDLRPAIEARLRPLHEDGLVILDGDQVRVTEEGFDFVRTIAAAFDARLDRAAHAPVA